ncbi:MAG: hypothetical protein CFE23_13485 [Flavobacterium sp. BFFFF1]|nr:MAG: hypothetical protein CFE23_13485 [Flavobacterium sp. BFFFF1]
MILKLFLRVKKLIYIILNVKCFPLKIVFNVFAKVEKINMFLSYVSNKFNFSDIRERNLNFFKY